MEVDWPRKRAALPQVSAADELVQHFDGRAAPPVVLQPVVEPAYARGTWERDPSSQNLAVFAEASIELLERLDDSRWMKAESPSNASD